ncbi:MAG: hypothetical protein FJX75_23590 [Armatimonadetes bacterium]|nr:hypothetical protein [Armatimonadota bacterium]
MSASITSCSAVRPRPSDFTSKHPLQRVLKQLLLLFAGERGDRRRLEAGQAFVQMARNQGHALSMALQMP